MSTAFVVAGFVLMAVGLFLLLRPPRTAPPTGAPQALPDIGKWLEELRKLLEAFDQRLRVGVFIVLLGFALSLVGVWLDVRDTNDKVDPPPARLQSTSSRALEVGTRGTGVFAASSRGSLWSFG